MHKLVKIYVKYPILRCIREHNKGKMITEFNTIEVEDMKNAETFVTCLKEYARKKAEIIVG